MNHSEFKNLLKIKIGENSKDRPFVCDGYPLETELFIIGINPATTMSENFFKFWENDKFDKKSWFEYYRKTRINEYYEISPTRRKIETLINDDFKNYNCLETNIYSKASKSISDLNNQNKNTDLLLFLIEAIKPKALFLHGKNPEKFIRQIFKINKSFDDNASKVYIPAQIVEYKYGEIAICAISHLRLTKKETISENTFKLINLIEKL